MNDNDNDMVIAPELQESLNSFMKMLQDDIRTYMGKETPFILKLDVKLGVRQEDTQKMQGYAPKLMKLLDGVPKELVETLQ